MSALLGRIPSAVGYQPTLATDMGTMQERITTTKKGSITSVQVCVYVCVCVCFMHDPCVVCVHTPRGRVDRSISKHTHTCTCCWDMMPSSLT